MKNDKLVIGGHEFHSRFILGSGKYSSTGENTNPQFALYSFVSVNGACHQRGPILPVLRIYAISDELVSND